MGLTKRGRPQLQNSSKWLNGSPPAVISCPQPHLIFWGCHHPHQPWPYSASWENFLIIRCAQWSWQRGPFLFRFRKLHSIKTHMKTSQSVLLITPYLVTVAKNACCLSWSVSKLCMYTQLGEPANWEWSIVKSPYCTSLPWQLHRLWELRKSSTSGNNLDVATNSQNSIWKKYMAVGEEKSYSDQ